MTVDIPCLGIREKCTCKWWNTISIKGNWWSHSGILFIFCARNNTFVLLKCCVFWLVNTWLHIALYVFVCWPSFLFNIVGKHYCSILVLVWWKLNKKHFNKKLHSIQYVSHSKGVNWKIGQWLGHHHTRHFVGAPKSQPSPKSCFVFKKCIKSVLLQNGQASPFK